MSHYPLVHIPPALTAALGALPPPPAPPTPAPLPRYPARPGFTLGQATWLLLLFGLVVGALVNAWDVVAGLLAIGAALSGWWVRRRAARRYAHAVETFHADFHRHRAYPAQCHQYEQVRAAYAQPEAIAQFRAGCVARVLASVTLHFRPVLAADYLPPQGRSEAVFAQYLRQCFGENTIYVNQRVRVDHLPAVPDGYYPDVVYRDASGLCIDVEIDEPYVWATGEPHHWAGQDDARNAFFLRHHWVVLRFTEEQAVRTPLACCQVLAALIFHLTGRHYAARQFGDRPARQPQWDWVEAKRLAARRTRESYQDGRLPVEGSQGNAQGTP